LVHEKHTAARRFFGDRVLGLAFSSDEKDRLSLSGEIGYELCGFLEQTQCLLKIDDVDAIALA
jgi:hypothetical protein